MKARIIYIFMLIAGLPFMAGAQKKWALKVSAEEAVANKDWFGAEQYYAKLYKKDSTSLKLRFAYAEVCRLNFDYELAYKLYLGIARKDDGRKYPLAYYWLGQILKSKQNYVDAKKWFIKFNLLKLEQQKFGYYNRKSLLEQEACVLAEELIKHPLKIKTEHPGEPINSKVSDYAAFEKDSTLYFSSLRAAYKDEEQADQYNKIFRSEYRNSKWGKVKALDTSFNKPHTHNSNTCFSPDFKQMIISRCKAKNASDFDCELYISHLKDTKWTIAERLPEPLNQASVSTTQANFGSADGKTILFFASNRPGGEGGYDIWYSVLKDDGSFEIPVNAGKKINTPDDEVTPWFVSEQKTLFFSSSYHKGLGAMDIFKSEFINNEFSEPVNAGFPINSGYNDTYYSINKAGTKLYVSSNRIGSLFDGKLNCCNDIFRFNIDTVKIKPVPTPTPVCVIPAIEPKEKEVVVLKEQLKLLVPLTLYFHNDEPNPRTNKTITGKNYETTYKEYRQLVSSYADLFSKDLNGKDKKAAIEEINSFFADSLDAGIRNLQNFCETLKKVLLNGETVNITFKGYCSPLASTDYNINLAKRRVSSLLNYFKEYDKGWFVRYINNTNAGEGKIVFDEVDVGELSVSKASDDFKDKRNSVYSPAAASERKIQILAVSFDNRNK